MHCTVCDDADPNCATCMVRYGIVEEIPDDCLPPPHVIEELLLGPKLDEQGRILAGVWQGMTQDEVLAERDAYNRACGL